MKARHQGRRTSLALLLSLAAGLAAGATSNVADAADDSPTHPGPDHSGEARQFDIEAGDAAARLNDFSGQSGLQLLFGFEVMKGIKLRAVHGRYRSRSTRWRR